MPDLDSTDAHPKVPHPLPAPKRYTEREVWRIALLTAAGWFCAGFFAGWIVAYLK